MLLYVTVVIKAHWFSNWCFQGVSPLCDDGLSCWKFDVYCYFSLTAPKPPVMEVQVLNCSTISVSWEAATVRPYVTLLGYQLSFGRPQERWKKNVIYTADESVYRHVITQLGRCPSIVSCPCSESVRYSISVIPGAVTFAPMAIMKPRKFLDETLGQVPRWKQVDQNKKQTPPKAESPSMLC